MAGCTAVRWPSHGRHHRQAEAGPSPPAQRPHDQLPGPPGAGPQCYLGPAGRAQRRRGQSPETRQGCTGPVPMAEDSRHSTAHSQGRRPERAHGRWGWGRKLQDEAGGQQDAPRGAAGMRIICNLHSPSGQPCQVQHKSGPEPGLVLREASISGHLLPVWPAPSSPEPTPGDPALVFPSLLLLLHHLLQRKEGLVT